MKRSLFILLLSISSISLSMDEIGMQIAANEPTKILWQEQLPPELWMTILYHCGVSDRPEAFFSLARTCKRLHALSGDQTLLKAINSVIGSFEIAIPLVKNQSISDEQAMKALVCAFHCQHLSAVKRITSQLKDKKWKPATPFVLSTPVPGARLYLPNLSYLHHVLKNTSKPDLNEGQIAVLQCLIEQIKFAAQNYTVPLQSSTTVYGLSLSADYLKTWISIDPTIPDSIKLRLNSIAQNVLRD